MIQQTVIRITLTFIVFAITLCLCACPKENQDTLREIARALHRVANATARADEVTYRFFLVGAIDGEEAEEVSIVLYDINTAALEFQKKARGYEVFDGNAKADILRLATDTRAYLLARINDGSARIKDERARAEWRAVINAAYDAFSSVVLLVRAAKPAPTPTPAPATSTINAHSKGCPLRSTRESDEGADLQPHLTGAVIRTFHSPEVIEWLNEY